MKTKLEFIDEKIMLKENELKSKIQVIQTYSDVAIEIIYEIEKLKEIKENLKE